MYSAPRLLIGLLLMGGMMIFATTLGPLAPKTNSTSADPQRAQAGTGAQTLFLPHEKNPPGPLPKTESRLENTSSIVWETAGTGRLDGRVLDRPTDSTPPGGNTLDPGSWLWPRLEEPQIRSTQATVRIQGQDPVAPRTLELWRVGAGPPESLGQTASHPDGHFDFGYQTLPQSEGSLVVTPPGVDPASVTPLRLRRRFVSHPHVRVEYDRNSLKAFMTPARIEGELQIHDEQDRLLGRFPIEGGAVQAEVDPGALSLRLYVTQVLPNGEESEPHLFHDPTGAPVLPSI